MAWYLVRVELHSASPGDYLKLHEAMEGVGFKRTISGDDGLEYPLPTAEYFIDIDIEEPGPIRDAVRMIADAIRPGMIIVAKTDFLAWRAPPLQ